MAARKRWYQTKKFWALILTPLALFLLIFYGLDPVVEWQTRKRLAMFAPQYTVTYEDARLQPTKLNYVITRVKFMKESAGGEKEPYLYIDRMEMSIYGRELLNGHLVATLEFQKVRMNLIAAKAKSDQQLEAEVPDFSEKLEALFALTVDRVEVRDGEVMFIDKSNKDFPKIWIHAIDGTLENLATRAALARGEPTTLALSGTLQDSGQLSVFVNADPLAKGLSFAGRANLLGFELKELGKTMASESGLTVSKGTLDVFAEFNCKAGRLAGGIKPVLKDVEVEQGKPGVANALKAVLADTAVNVLSNKKGDLDTVATVVPIHGDLTSPDVQLWPAVIGVIRNAFVIGVTESYTNLPPPQAREKENPVKQLIKGLDKKDQPKAQPDGRGK